MAGNQGAAAATSQLNPSANEFGGGCDLDVAVDAIEQRSVRRRLTAACFLAGLFMLIEGSAGWWIGSVAILSDAAHMLSDVGAFLVSIYASWAALQPATQRYTYGYRRVEIIGALASVLIIWLVTGALVYEAVLRVLQPVLVDGQRMLYIACAGIVFNVAVAAVLRGGHAHHDVAQPVSADDAERRAALLGHQPPQHSHLRGSASDNINMRSAILHVLGDLLQSMGVAIAAALIWLHQGDITWALVDPITTFVFSVVVLCTTLKIMRDIVHVLMERAPAGLSMDELNTKLRQVAGVQGVSDLHVWSITSGMVVVSGHVQVDGNADAAHVLQQLQHHAHTMGIRHCTFQLDPLVL